MKICLTGGTGKLGQEVLQLIPNAIPLVRKPLGHRNEQIVDFSNFASLKKALSDCDVLIHLAGSMEFYDEKGLYEGNVLLTKNLLSALPKNSQVVYASSVSVYGKELGGKADEDTPANPDSAYARTKYEAERMVMLRPNSVALRIGPIYGPQYSDYSKFLRMIKKGKMVIFGDGKNIVSFAHVSDVAKAVRNAVNAKAGIYVVSGPGKAQEKIYATAAQEMGVAAPKIKIPLKIALVVARAEEMLAKIMGKKPLITREHVNILGRSRVFDFSKAKKYLGFRPRTLEKGIKEMVNAV